MTQNGMLSNITINYNGKQLKSSTKFRKGNNKLIVFIHGLGCSKESFEDVWYSSNFKNYSILTFDLIGFGNSSKPHDFSYTIEEQAEICKLLLDKFQYPTIHIVAHSMGGAVGLLLTEMIKDNLASFINVEGNLIGEDCGISRRTAKISFEKFKNNMFNRLKFVAKSSDESDSKLWAKMLETSDPLGFYKTSESLVEWSDSNKLLKIFHSLQLNKSYIYGDKNSQMNILDELIDIKKISISNSGHFVMNDNPSEFYQTIYKLLANR
ncbi:alpha/beta fold hydrolase [Clostridium ganghwense]|uniref:Alpha/beta fold hydrolase n=1 Tax=Clostridium ganghwense TaxID=312089 RepID=A0ABT4CKB1_9CLOT|nr:alpha/beta fold hydrolase [Clostridium ganghwense]MCY6369482.1 alpha/beta fold hydrolase [Clostridium ganghwense]